MSSNKTILKSGLLGIFFKLIDIYTTLLAVSDNIKYELNPTVRNMLHQYGVIPGLVINFIAIFSMLILLYKYKKPVLLWASAVLLGIIAFINILDKFLFGYILR
jgi:hypothetical protein